MKSKKFILQLCALCMALSISIGFTSCDFSSLLNRNSTTPTESEATNTQTSEPTSENSENDNSSDSSKNDNTNETTDVHQVTEEEWNAAFSPNAFTNFTASVTESSTENGESYTMSHTIKVDGFKAYMNVIASDTFTPYQFYLSQEGAVLYMYMDMMGTGSFNKSPMPDNSLFDMLDFESNTFLNLYSSFVYNAKNKTYTADRIQPDAADETYVLTDISIKFTNGNLVACNFTSISTEEGITSTTVENIVFSNFGTTVVDLPAVEEIPDVAGDGLISKNEWEKALSPEAFKNVTLKTVDENGDTILIKYDNKNPNVIYTETTFNGVDEDGIPYSSHTKQYHQKTENGIFSYIYMDNQWYKIESELAAWNTFNAFRVYGFDGSADPNAYYDYHIFTFNGLTAIVQNEDFSLTITFNQKEQIISAIATIPSHYTYTFSNYGTTTVTLPASYIDFT